MKVHELVKALAKYSSDANVYIWDCYKDEIVPFEELETVGDGVILNN